IGRRDLDFWRKVDLMSFFIIASIVTDKLKIHLPFSCLATFYFFSRFLFRTGVEKRHDARVFF
ncbi:MAG: hypothetical protein RSE01_04535, partial [Akkermansia sp.]